jgi:ferredoxin-NADP reductase
MNDASGVPVATTWRAAVIERIAPQTARVRSYFLTVDLPRHVAGQHVDVRLTAPDGYQAQRSYSIASRPGAPELELAIERLDDGEVSPYFHEVARPGDAIEVRGPIGGHFIWRASDGGPLLLVGGGSGVVPLVAMLRERTATAPGTPTLLVHSARTFDEVIFRDELLRADRDDPAFTLVLATTRGPAQRAGDRERRLDRAALDGILAGWGRVPLHAYVCGSNAFVGSMSEALVHAGVPAASVRTERYGG